MKSDPSITHTRIGGVWLRRADGARTWLSRPSMVSHFIVLGLSLDQRWTEEKPAPPVCYLCGNPIERPVAGIEHRVFCSVPCLEEYAS